MADGTAVGRLVGNVRDYWRARWPEPGFRLLLLIIALGTVLRFWGLDFGLPNDSRPDEYPNLQVILFNLVGAWVQGDFSMHPHFFSYPSLYFYILSFVFGFVFLFQALTGRVENWQGFLVAHEVDPTDFHLVLRGFSALCGVLTILVMYALAKTWFRDEARGRTGEAAGLMAAFFTAVNYLLVRNSHFGTVDSMLGLGIAFSLYRLLLYQRDPSWPNLKWACIAIGLAIGAKYPAAVLLVALWVSIFRHFFSPGKIDWGGFFKAILKPTGLALLVFFLTSPWILLDLPAFLRGMEYEATYYFGFTMPGLPTGWVFYPTFALFYGMGGLVLLFSLLGLVRVFVKKDPDRVWEHAMLLGFGFAYFLLLGFNERLQTRYALPMAPFLILYAIYGLKWLLHRLWRVLEIPSPENRAIVTAVLALAVSYQTFYLSWGFSQRMSQPDTRSIARAWIMANVPPNTPVAIGPWHGHIHLPGQYGQLAVFTGPDQFNPPERLQVREVTLRTRLVNAYEAGNLRKMDIRYVVAYQGLAAFGNRPWEMEALQAQAQPVFAVTPLKPGATEKEVGRFDPLDAFYLPYDDFHAFERPGPLVVIYDLQAAPDKSGSMAPAGAAPQSP